MSLKGNNAMPAEVCQWKVNFDVVTLRMQTHLDFTVVEKMHKVTLKQRVHYCNPTKN